MRKPATHEVILLAVLAAITAFLLQHSVVRAQQAKHQVFTEFSSKLALDGYDPVAYFKDGKPLKGNPAHTAGWKGAEWRFASAENKGAFEASPERFAPQFGGYCAWAVSQGYTAKGDPKVWRIVDGKLYVNYNASVQKTWETDIPGNIAKGDKNWPAVLTK